MVCLILIALILSPAAPEQGYASLDSRTKEIILNKALETLNKYFDTDEYRFEVSARWIPASLLRVDPADIKAVELVGAVEKYTNFEVIFQDGRRQQRSAQIQLSIDAEQKLPVANHRLMSGEVIKPKDIRLQWVSVLPGKRRWISNSDSLVGKTLRRTLLPGQPIGDNEISTVYIVEAGDPVQLLFEEQGVKISIRGEARQNGAKNDEIRIYSNETRRKYLGRVIGPGVATWQKTLY